MVKKPVVLEAVAAILNQTSRQAVVKNDGESLCVVSNNTNSYQLNRKGDDFVLILDGEEIDTLSNPSHEEVVEYILSIA